MKILAFEATNAIVDTIVYTNDGDVVTSLTSIDHRTNHVHVKMSPDEAIKYAGDIIAAANRIKHGK